MAETVAYLDSIRARVVGQQSTKAEAPLSEDELLNELRSELLTLFYERAGTILHRLFNDCYVKRGYYTTELNLVEFACDSRVYGLVKAIEDCAIVEAIESVTVEAEDSEWLYKLGVRVSYDNDGCWQLSVEALNMEYRIREELIKTFRDNTTVITERVTGGCEDCVYVIRGLSLEMLPQRGGLVALMGRIQDRTESFQAIVVDDKWRYNIDLHSRSGGWIYNVNATRKRV